MGTGTVNARSDRVVVHIGIDVANLEAGLQFYGSLFGFVEKSRPFPTMAVMDAGNVTICMLEKAAGTVPFPEGEQVRRYERHWTPVHLDLHVENFDEIVAKVSVLGGRVEREFRDHGPKPAAFCSDPFGNGFCVIGEDPP